MGGGLKGQAQKPIKEEGVEGELSPSHQSLFFTGEIFSWKAKLKFQI